MSYRGTFALAAATVMCFACLEPSARAQTPATPPPQLPVTPPATKPGSDLVLNPTTAECVKGWMPELKWTKDQFDQFCAQMNSAK